jgi:ABC-type Fe3+ transport system substrate-binding protein
VYAGALGLQLQHRAAEEEEHSRAQVLVRSHEARVQGRDPGRESELVGHVVHDAGDSRAAHGRGQGVRLPEGAAQERQPVHEVRCGAARAAATGESLVGITFQHDAVVQAIGGAPVKIVSPCEGTGYEIGSMSIIKGAKNMENAKKWYDWALGAEAQSIGRTGEGLLPGAVEQECERAGRRRRSSPRSSSSTTISPSTARRRSATELLTKWDKEVSTLPK